MTGLGIILAIGGATIAFLAGRASQARGFRWSMRNDPLERRELLEQLAQLEGVTLQGRE